MCKKPFLHLILALTVFVLAVAPTSALAQSPSRSLVVTVVGQNGQPMPEATVQLLIPGSPDMTTVQTAPNGEARLQVPAGFSFWLRAWADGHAVLEVPYVPGTDGTVLTLQAEAYHAAVVGIVTDERGRPVPDAHVTVWRNGAGLEGSAVTNAVGAYHIEKLPGGGGYTLQVEATSFQPYVATDLTLSAGSVNQTDVGLTPAIGTVTGEVVGARTGRPVPAVHVELILNGWGVVARTSTDAYGYFRFAAPPQGNQAYQIRIFGNGYETLTSGQFTVPAGSWTDFSGADRFTLNELYAELSGLVLTDSGNPLANVVVELQRLNLGAIETVKTDSNGAYAFSELPAGTYRVRAYPVQGRIHASTGWINLQGGGRVNADVSANPPDTKSFGSSAIVGTVRDHQDKPLSGVTVVVSRGIDSVETVTDAKGAYRVSVQANVEDAVNPEVGTGYHVAVSLDGYLPTDQQNPQDDGAPSSFVDVRGKATNRADFVLYPAQTEIAGRVFDEDGKPLPGITVQLHQEGEGKVAEVTTDGVGRYRFANLQVAKQARYLPVVVHDGYFDSSLEPDGTLTALTSLEPGTVVTRTLTARPATGAIQGLVKAGRDKLAQMATVTVIRPADGRRWSAITDSTGHYSVTVPAGPGDRYLVRVEGTNAKAGAGSSVVSLQQDRAVTVNMDVVPYATVTGRVHRVGGAPSADTVVAIWAEGEGKMLATTRTDATGAYRFDGLEAGRRYSVAAWGGKDSWGALTPGEPIITPFVVPAPAETIWIDMRAPLLPTFTPAGDTP